MALTYKGMAIQVNIRGTTAPERQQKFPVVLSCLVVSVKTVLEILIYFPDELWNHMTIFYYNRCYILMSLLCHLLKIKCIICCSFSGGRWG